MTSNDPKAGPAVYALWRTGAAALAAGALATAVYAARLAVERDLVAIFNALAASEAATASEKIHAELFGNYLGDAGLDALSGFARLVDDLAPAFKG